jgi:hypothetical protein
MSFTISPFARDQVWGRLLTGGGLLNTPGDGKLSPNLSIELANVFDEEFGLF